MKRKSPKPVAIHDPLSVPVKERKTRDKEYTAENVLDAAYERVRYLYQNFDHVSLSFSGGKDSTACLHVCLDVAKEFNRLPLRVCFYDEEIIPPPTIEYVHRVAARPDVQMEWYCLPFKHRNACSNEQPEWECWQPELRDLWVRELPPEAITEHPVFQRGMSPTDFSRAILRRNECSVLGIRTQESLRRFRMMTMKRNENYIARMGSFACAYPIYDWSSVDVWRLVHERGYDYNTTYDVFNRTNLYNNLLAQRVCPPFGDEPLRGLWKYAQCWPDMWAKMCKRVPGVNTAARYANTELYKRPIKPDGQTWQQYMELLLENWDSDEARAQIRAKLDRLIRMHFARTIHAIHDVYAHPITGVCWRFLAFIAAKGDLKGRQSGMVTDWAHKECTRLGITLSEALRDYGMSPKWRERPAEEFPQDAALQSDACLDEIEVDETQPQPAIT